VATLQGSIGIAYKSQWALWSGMVTAMPSGRSVRSRGASACGNSDEGIWVAKTRYVGEHGAERR
jgi:hypothetical protein